MRRWDPWEGGEVGGDPARAPSLARLGSRLYHQPACPSGRQWALNSKQASNGFDMLVHMSYLAQKTDCPRLTGVPADTDTASGLHKLLKRKIF